MFRSSILAIAAVAAAPAPPDPVEITEWPVPWENTRPRDPYVGPDGRVWFVGQTGDYVGVLAPESGKFDRFALPGGAGPHNLIVAADGKIWYAGNRAAHIGILDPASGEIAQVQTPAGVRDPHTLVWDSKGDIWFTAQQSNYVGRVDVATRAVHVVPVATARARPYGIVVDRSDRPWIVLFGTNKLATVDWDRGARPGDPATATLREIALPRPEARPRRLVVTSDGVIWYGDYAKGYLGRYDPRDGQFKEWPLPAGEAALPYAMTVDDKDRIWLVETGVRPNRFVAFDPARGAFLRPTEIPSGGGSVRHMVFDARTRSIWFGTDAGTIGRAKLTD
jgi:virginiamycin B lyase